MQQKFLYFQISKNGGICSAVPWSHCFDMQQDNMKKINYNKDLVTTQ